jgi:general secretion pathway protein A
MYRKYFGMKKPPFSIAPDPRYLYMSEQHREALAHLLYGIRSEGGFVLLTGEVGTGKTTTCRHLLETLSKNIVTAFIIHPTYSVEELLAAVCDEFGIRYPKKTTIKSLVDLINTFLLDLNSKRRKAILIIDEAQDLSSEVLEEIRLLTNLETNERKLLQIILVGQPELRDKLSRPELRQLAQRIVARCHLGPLSKADVANYVNHRLTVARAKGEIFPNETLRCLYHYSGGIPRLINVICDRSLLGAFVEGKQSVDKATLRKAAGEALGGCVPGAGRAWKAALLAGILIFAGAGLVYFCFTAFEPPRNSAKNTGMSGISGPVLDVPQPAEPGVSGTKADKAEKTESGAKEQKAATQVP